MTSLFFRLFGALLLSTALAHGAIIHRGDWVIDGAGDYGPVTDIRENGEVTFTMVNKGSQPYRTQLIELARYSKVSSMNDIYVGDWVIDGSNNYGPVTEIRETGHVTFTQVTRGNEPYRIQISDLTRYRKVSSMNNIHVGDWVIDGSNDYGPVTEIRETGDVTFTQVTRDNQPYRLKINELTRYRKVSSMDDIHVGDWIIDGSNDYGPVTEIRETGDITFTQVTRDHQPYRIKISDLRRYRKVSSMNNINVGDWVIDGSNDYGPVTEIRETGDVTFTQVTRDHQPYRIQINELTRYNPTASASTTEAFPAEEPATDVLTISIRADYPALVRVLKNSKADADVLERTIAEAVTFAQLDPAYRRKVLLLALGMDSWRHWRFTGTNRRLATRASLILERLYGEHTTAPQPGAARLRVEEFNTSSYRDTTVRYRVAEADPELEDEYEQWEKTHCKTSLGDR